jgi:predicted ribosomally synthesized peptide with nif11-like leader
MSRESFKTFMAKVQQDKGLRQELRAAGGEAGMPAEAIVAFAADKGYEFKVEDISSELTDAQLDSVAGGMSDTMKQASLSTYLSSAGSMMFKF